jgi:hypothetical protein
MDILMEQWNIISASTDSKNNTTTSSSLILHLVYIGDMKKNTFQQIGE